MQLAQDKVARAKTLLKRAAPGLSQSAQAELAVEVAHELLGASHRLSTPRERAQAARLRALMHDDKGQAFATALTDRVHRSKSGAQLVRQVRSLIREFGIPRSLQRLDRLELRALNSFGASLPELTAAAVRQRILHDASPYIVSADPDALARYLKKLADENVRVNVNHLGEEVLGEREAERHLAAYLDLLERPEVSTISVKISSLYSQLRPLAYEHCLSILQQRLKRIYGKALAGSHQKLVYLDMESFRDLDMTVELFMRVLGEPEFDQLMAGIVLQAYIPESVHFQERLTGWAVERTKAGKAPIRVRIVKGANLAMERLEASHRGWPLVTYFSKHEVDANYKRLLYFACRPEHACAVHLGVASHNLFDLSLALVLRQSEGVERYVELEMLEGMAQPLRRALQAVSGGVLVYAPSVDTRSFPAAVAYLVRRLDENTGEDNFLRYSFGMQPGDASFRAQASAFLEACSAKDEVSHKPRRARGLPLRVDATEAATFENEPDTDFTSAANRANITEELERARAAQFEVPLQLAGQRWLSTEQKQGVDPSRPGFTPYRHSVAGAVEIELAIHTAHSEADEWARVPTHERINLILKVSEELRKSRAELVSHMVLDAGKRIEEADVEVSEAVDFGVYYARQFSRFSQVFEVTPKGVVLVTPPWNFPLAIPFGGVAAALVAGNSVILKPAPETVLVAATLVRLCHEAGIPERVLQFLVCDDELGSRLIRDERIAMVVLTGATATGQLFHRLRPGLDLVAETGGKNAVYVSDLSDHEQACRHVVNSAFSHSGQKCSACSLLILHRDLYYDESFKSQLYDATRSLVVGSAWHPESFVTPLIREPDGPLRQSIEQLQRGEEWLLEPSRDEHNPRLLSPGIRWNVAPGSFAHVTEFFGPVLSVMHAPDLRHAVDLINQTPYGLTSGIESLDPLECQAFADRVEAGNVYQNHPITGAIVGRQPFGGRKASGFGPGAKAGGPNYVTQFCWIGQRRGRVTAPALSRGPRHVESPSMGRFEPAVSTTADIEKLAGVLSEQEQAVFSSRMLNYREVFDLEFACSHPQAEVLGEHNVLRYQPSKVLLLLTPSCSPLDALSSLFAARLTGAALTLLMSSELNGRPVFKELEPFAQNCDSAKFLKDALVNGRVERLRCPGKLPNFVNEIPSELPVFVAAGPVHEDGYVELRRYLSEQTVCTSYHRYGNLMQPRGVRG